MLSSASFSSSSAFDSSPSNTFPNWPHVAAGHTDDPELMVVVVVIDVFSAAVPSNDDADKLHNEGDFFWLFGTINTK